MSKGNVIIFLVATLVIGGLVILLNKSQPVQNPDETVQIEEQSKEELPPPELGPNAKEASDDECTTTYTCDNTHLLVACSPELDGIVSLFDIETDELLIQCGGDFSEGAGPCEQELAQRLVSCS